MAGRFPRSSCLAARASVCGLRTTPRLPIPAAVSRIRPTPISGRTCQGWLFVHHYRQGQDRYGPAQLAAAEHTATTTYNIHSEVTLGPNTGFTKIRVRLQEHLVSAFVDTGLTNVHLSRSGREKVSPAAPAVPRPFWQARQACNIFYSLGSGSLTAARTCKRRDIMFRKFVFFIIATALVMTASMAFATYTTLTTAAFRQNGVAHFTERT